MKLKYKTIAVDWDGTFVDDGQFPEIGEPKPNAVKVVKRLIDSGARIIIWTCRGGEGQVKGITDKLNENGIYDFVVNKHIEDITSQFEYSSPKVFCDVYIDDRSLHAVNGIDWFEIEKMIFE